MNDIPVTHDDEPATLEGSSSRWVALLGIVMVVIVLVVGVSAMVLMSR